jgi:hypothetical protein
MNSKNRRQSKRLVKAGIFACLLWLPAGLAGSEIYIYRRFDPQENLFDLKKVVVHGEFFGQLLAPSNFPSYNDLTGRTDRWNYGFHNYVLLTRTTLLHGQLNTHDNNGERTKFDWHFSLRQQVLENLTLEIGHDSDHDSEHASVRNGRVFYTNRNYIGVYLPWNGESFVIEPFLRLFHHSNQRVNLDLSGEKLAQEFGLRVGAAFGRAASVSIQVMGQSSNVFGRSEAWLGDLMFRARLAQWLEVTLGGGFWSDLVISPFGNKQTYYKLIWGIAVPF